MLPRAYRDPDDDEYEEDEDGEEEEDEDEDEEPLQASLRRSPGERRTGQPI